MSESALQRLSQAERLLAAATIETLPEVGRLIDLAEAARVYAQRVDLGTRSINHAQRIKLLAEMRLADIIDRGQESGDVAAGPGRPAKTSTARTLSDLGVDRRRLGEARKIRAAIGLEELDAIVDAANDEGRELSRAEFLRAQAAVITLRDSDEYYTPIRYIEAAREVMGRIDLDPASCDFAQARINASQYFTKADDGLSRPWRGSVWLNPPYSQPLCGQFVAKLIEEFSCGRIDQAVVLVNAATDTAWFHSLVGVGDLCLVRGRINFDRETGGTFANRYAQAFFYLGDRRERFLGVFSKFGAVGTLGVMS